LRVTVKVKVDYLRTEQKLISLYYEETLWFHNFGN